MFAHNPWEEAASRGVTSCGESGLRGHLTGLETPLAAGRTVESHASSPRSASDPQRNHLSRSIQGCSGSGLVQAGVPTFESPLLPQLVRRPPDARRDGVPGGDFGEAMGSRWRGEGRLHQRGQRERLQGHPGPSRHVRSQPRRHQLTSQKGRPHQSAAVLET